MVNLTVLTFIPSDSVLKVILEINKRLKSTTDIKYISHVKYKGGWWTLGWFFFFDPGVLLDISSMA